MILNLNFGQLKIVWNKSELPALEFYSKLILSPQEVSLAEM